LWLLLFPLGLLLSLGNASPASGEERRFSLEWVGGEMSEGSNVLEVQESDRVVLLLKSDRPMTVHLHGYDLEFHLEANREASAAFDARFSGRFPAEAHGSASHKALFYLEVQP
jgi:hypothetical protein